MFIPRTAPVYSRSSWGATALLSDSAAASVEFELSKHILYLLPPSYLDVDFTAKVHVKPNVTTVVQSGLCRFADVNFSGYSSYTVTRINGNEMEYTAFCFHCKQ